ncbi:MAG: phospho-N-acetylmuramoyl-pentapeptide-transferase [Acidimicrobiales bacterium]|nr:MAG: phospho-N-acetylmuramoyl-pentapeptide-transferase [Acidimicrobiales bacterium]
MIQLLVASSVAMLVSLFGTRWLIEFLRGHGIGQPIREEGPKGHVVKAGTPTMGGAAIVIAAICGYLSANLTRGVFTWTGLLVMAAVVGAAGVGLADDWLKVSRARNLGLAKGTKMVGLMAVACGFAAAMLLMADQTGRETTLSFTRFDNPGLELGNVGWFVVAVLWFVGTTNAVNLTDGLDGLAAGAAALAYAAFVIIAFWAFRNPEIYRVEHAQDLAVIAAAMLGGCAGFLWWNAAPARIFMGDTGSLAIGAGLAGLALTTNTQLLLPIVGGLFVAETVSVIVQVAVFKITGGRRVFRMAPLHHHFELGGWPETTVIVRFWILAGMSTAIAVGIFYADFVAIGGVNR